MPFYLNDKSGKIANYKKRKKSSKRGRLKKSKGKTKKKR